MKKNVLKKIIVFYPSFERGGVEIVLVNLINFFLKQKIEIVLITSNFKKKLIKNELFNCKYIKIAPFSFLPDRINKALSASRTLKNELKKSEKKNTIVFSLQGSSLAIIIGKFFGFKIIVRNAEDVLGSTIYSENKIQSLIVLLFKLFSYNFADKIITNSKGSGNSIRKILLKKKKIYPIYNPYLKKIYKNTINKRRNFIISTGRLVKQKDFHNLIIAFNIIKNKIPDYKLIIIGDGQLKKQLKNLVDNLGLNKRIIFTGWKVKLKRYYINSKLFILNSLYEGLGNVLIDAANYNLPIITTNCNSGPKEIIDYGKGGFLVPIKSPRLLSEKILFCINNYKISIKKSKYAKKRLERFNCEINCNSYFKLISKTINE